MTAVHTEYQGNLQYAADIVLCIDATGSMSPVLESVKESALNFHDRLTEVMEKKGKSISQLRLKTIVFRDFGDDPDDAIEQTDFLELPAQAAQFESFLRGIRATGGGDVPESGLEALSLAIKAPWERGLDRRRHVIVMFTDAPAHPLGSVGVEQQTYPAGIPRSYDDLFELWGYAGSQGAVMEQSAKRLVLFAPDEQPWEDIAKDWDLTLQFPSKAGMGLEEFEMSEIIDTIANSL
ncbi:vWA domain-containing protein [Streptomyces triticirhizae]|uniref:VWA domain-containing protein n=1 Tax=Streptomyces triticirhizae TaxID=2483353 RepID=A0A3M2LVN3_9ACTN|nr:vWA domain-containing protein [Streptomyces triticirhizae]RMI41437.1 VWA domain-containing protein [Streptomyces triticirhizae]